MEYIYIKNAIVTSVLGNVGLHLRISKNSEKECQICKKLNFMRKLNFLRKS